MLIGSRSNFIAYLIILQPIGGIFFLFRRNWQTLLNLNSGPDNIILNILVSLNFKEFQSLKSNLMLDLKLKNKGFENGAQA